MKAGFRGLYLALGLLLNGVPASAHHSFTAEYDSSKPVTHSGVVTKIDWMNPHVHIYIDEKAQRKNGEPGLRRLPPNTLRRVGLAKDMLKIGDSITVTGWIAKDGSQRFAGREISWPNGRKFFFTSLAVAALLGLYPFAVSAQTSPAKPIPGTADGKPDLSGIWQVLGVSLTGETAAQPGGAFPANGAGG